VCDIAPKIDSPYRNLGQTDQLPGLFVVFTAEPCPDCPAVGAYVGDRTFWMLNQLKPDATQDTPSTTSTTAHEMGHTFYLRHSHTDYWRTKVNLSYKIKDGSADGAPPNADSDGEVVLLKVQRDFSNLEDHDQHDAYACLQSYSRPITAEPCGMCALILRFYDRVKMAASGEFRSGIDDGLSPMILAKFMSMAGSNYNANVYKINGGPHELPDVRKNTSVFLLALGKKTNYTDRGGTAMVGRVNGTVAHEGPGDDPTTFWSKESGPAVAFATQGDFMKVTAGNALGDVVIKYSRGGQEVTGKFKIVN
jgi:hypothetical protein